jgi:hypothetical protein
LDCFGFCFVFLGAGFFFVSDGLCILVSF